MKIFVSGLSGVETTLAVHGFPVTYYPVDYPFFGINTEVSGSGFRIAAGLRALGDDVEFLTVIGGDNNGERVTEAVREAGLGDELVLNVLKNTVETVALQEMPFGRRQVYCDLKDAQEKHFDPAPYRSAISESDVCVLCNVNFNRALIPEAKNLGKTIATDVQNLTDINDSFNAEFIDNADILFLSDEGAPNAPQEFLASLAKKCSARIIVMGLAEDGLLCYDRAMDKPFALNAVNVGDVITAGAGSALLSGFLHYYGRYDTVDALKRAEVFAALKLVKNSAGGGFASEREVEEKLQHCVF